MAIYLALMCQAHSQTVNPTLDPNEPAGERPYEMVWAHRTESSKPTVVFDHLEGWSMQVQGGAEASLRPSRAQNVWERPVGHLRYRGSGKADDRPSVTLVPPRPVQLPAPADSVDMWVYGNRWDWEHPPGTPPVRVVLHLRDSQDTTRELTVDSIRWQQWWLMHKRLPTGLKPPVSLESVELSGGWQPEWRELFLDSVRFYQEELSPLKFEPRPKRKLKLAEGQTAGANTGPGQLPFPTREETILPLQLGGHFKNQLTAAKDAQFDFQYIGSDCNLDYFFNAERGFEGLDARWKGGETICRPLEGAAVRLSTGTETKLALKSVNRQGKVVTASYTDGTTLRLQIWQKSLVIDVSNTSGRAIELNFGHIAGVAEPRTIWVPYLTYGGGAHPCVSLSRAGTNYVFTSLWLDWYRSNGSEPFAAESVGTNSAKINGGVRYQTLTDGRRNPLFERLFLTVSPMFEEVLPTVPNPVGLHANDAVGRLWQESWGPDDYEKQMKRSRMLRAYGIEKLIQCNHEITWRDAGESFTLRTRAAPKKGGDTALENYIAHQRGLGWLAGLYSNYTDYSPVNEFWTSDGVQRLSDGNWRSAWPRCWAEKPLKAVEFDALLAPQIKAKFHSDSAYTDVQTAVAPWGYNDYDARVPGAGTFAQTFYAYAELLRNDSKVYDGPIFSEGTYQWLYAGLADGNYALAYDHRPLAKEPLLPVFDLYQIHSKECDIGMGWTENFCEGIPDWQKPENLDRSIDRFLLHTLAYGHIGWLVEEAHGIDRMCRSYYMLQQVQARYGLKVPKRIAYWDGNKLVGVSEALVNDLPRTRRQLFVEYPVGLQLWLNDHPSENWVCSTGCGATRANSLHAPSDKLDLPTAGWAAMTANGELLSFSALDGTNRVDYLRSPAYVYLDGRGHWFDSAEAGSDGGLAITSPAKDRLEIIHISGTAKFTIRRPFNIRGSCVACDAFDVDGKLLGKPLCNDTGAESRITPLPGAIKYVLKFGPLR